MNCKCSAIECEFNLIEFPLQKLLWVVSQTLMRNKLDGTNAKFKEYATTMAKVVKRLYLEGVTKTGYSASSVSEQMAK